LPAKDDQISSIAVSLRGNWNVRYVAPVHCTGEPAFAILKETSAIATFMLAWALLCY
jgi:7,8-dihydropterin-6-yl-methyl-4-(beta-D-ribofuranosyl)aminobenzene 5'-phosphate synthase